VNEGHAGIVDVGEMRPVLSGEHDGHGTPYRDRTASLAPFDAPLAALPELRGERVDACCGQGGP
jgi:hypothetical protein